MIRMRIFLITLLLINFFAASAQTTETVYSGTKDKYDNKSYLIIKSLTLKPGFQVSALSDGGFYARPQPMGADNVPPSLDKNFVRTETILVGGVVEENNIPYLKNNEKTTSFNYIDGVGRSLQYISVKSSPALVAKDVIRFSSFDTDSWQTKTYLPYTSSSNTNGAYQSSPLTDQQQFYTSTPKVAVDSRAFSESVIEKSPLGRIKSSFGPGILWNNGTVSKNVTGTTQFLLSGNPSDLTSKIRVWVLNASNLPTTTLNYYVGSLSMNVVTAEDGNVVKSYTDMRGQKVMVESNGLQTYYVYDLMGRLRYVLPPELNKTFTPDITTVTIDQTTLNRWTFQYNYDERRRLANEKGPGIDNDWIYYVYDQWDRLVLKQDGAQRVKSPQEWSFIKYDDYNRAIVTGIIKSNLSYASMILAVSGSRYEVEDASQLGYTLTNTFPSTSNSNILSIEPTAASYFDDYSFLNINGWSENNTLYNPDPGLTYMTSVKGQATGSQIKILGQNNWLSAVSYYDKNYRPVQTIKENHLSSTPDRITNVYNFVGWVMQTSRKHYDPFATSTKTIVEDYEYDHRGRLIKTFHQIDSNPRVLLAAYNYNELGQLVETNLHSTDNGLTSLQSVDYRYNIRGWLTSINNSQLSSDGTTNDDTNDLFGLNLVYNDQTLNINGTNSQPLYDGRITAAQWKTDNKKQTPKERAYAYHYDAKQRFEKARFAAKTGSAWTDEAGFYNTENLQYDDNGNILKLKRYGKSNNAAVVIDDLTYGGYATTGNQLTTVEEGLGSNFGYPNATTGVSPEMQYDKNGNLTSDLNAQITSVTYNYLNLPDKITIDLPGTTNDYFVEYTYDATGYVLKKVLKKGTATIRTVDYVRGIQYYNQQLSIIFTKRGRATKFRNTFEYEYFLSDHLSNTRVVFGNLHDTDVYKATMEPASYTEESQQFKNVPAPALT